MKKLGSLAGYFSPDGMSLREIAKRVKSGDKTYDTVSFVDTTELAIIRDYNWNRNNLRDGSVPDGPPDKEGCPTKYRRGVDGPERWDGLVDWMREYGWNCDPAHVHVGRDGKMKLAEGNHRLAVAESIGLDSVPVQFHTVPDVWRTSDRANPPRQLAALPRIGRIPLATAKRALKSLGRKAAACRITPEALREGMEVEREHRDVTRGGMLKTAKIAAAHLCEDQRYYPELKKLERKLKRRK